MAEEEKKKARKGGISRREFIKGTGLAVGGVAITSTVLSVACNPAPAPPPPPVVTPPESGGTPVTPGGTPPGSGGTPVMPPPGSGQAPSASVQPGEPQPPPPSQIQAPEGVVTLNINNQKVVMEVQPEWSVAFVLREKLGLVGLKVGCDRGECGACNILVDGRTHLACTMMAIESEGMDIVTIEGLPNGPTLHPVQQLFLDNDTFQCGYCTPGMIMSAVALMENTPQPTLQQAREAIAGNLCYCGDYTRIVRTIAKGL
jgi:xanthine dehydrogenase YagT iron-sulfur-binding subunit